MLAFLISSKISHAASATSFVHSFINFEIKTGINYAIKTKIIYGSKVKNKRPAMLKPLGTFVLDIMLTVFVVFPLSIFSVIVPFWLDCIAGRYRYKNLIRP